MPGTSMKSIRLFTLHRAWRIPALFLLIGMVISGCESVYVHFGNISSMRVQVDVYKGPLGDELPTQWANLSEVGNEFSLRLQQYNADVRKDIAIDDYCKDSVLDGLGKKNGTENLEKVEILENLVTRQKASKSTETPQDESDKRVLNGLPLDCYILIALNLDSKGLYAAARKEYTFKEALLKPVKDIQTSITRSQTNVKDEQEDIMERLVYIQEASQSMIAGEKIKEAEGVIAVKQKEIEEAQAVIDAKQKEVEEAQAAIAAKQKEIEEAQAVIAAKQKEIEEAEAEIAAKQKEIEEAKAMMAAKQKEIEEAQATIAEKQKGGKEVEAEIAAKREEIEEAEAEIAAKQKEIKEAEAVIAAKQKGGEEAEAEIATKREEINRKKSLIFRELENVSHVSGRVIDLQYYDRICSEVNLTNAQRDSAYQEICSQVGKHLFVSAKARIASHYWSILSGIHYPNERKVRQQMASYANLTAQFSQELRYRADIILKQLDGLNAKNAPLALKLRNTSFNDFLNLYVWYRAADFPIWAEYLSEGPYIFSAEQTRDRVRAMEMLYDYESWENINEVYANGQGKFSLALIKDRIGNWRLKSYESDPSELLAAYTKVGTTLLKSATSLAGKLAKGPASSVDLVNIKNMTTTGAKMVIATQASTNVEQDVTKDTETSNTAPSTQQSGTEVTPKMLFAVESSRKNANQTLGSLLHGFSKNSAVNKYRDLLRWEEIEKTIPGECFEENGTLKTREDLNRFDLIKCIGPIERHQAKAKKYGARPLEGQPKNRERTEIRKQYAAQLGQLFTDSEDQLQIHAKTIETLKPR